MVIGTIAAWGRIEPDEDAFRAEHARILAVMNLAIFECIEVGPDAEITGTELTPSTRPYPPGSPASASPSPPEGYEGPGPSRHGRFATYVRPCPLFRTLRKPRL